jgi:hypothetical protein
MRDACVVAARLRSVAGDAGLKQWFDASFLGYNRWYLLVLTWLLCTLQMLKSEVDEFRAWVAESKAAAAAAEGGGEGGATMPK